MLAGPRAAGWKLPIIVDWTEGPITSRSLPMQRADRRLTIYDAHYLDLALIETRYGDDPELVRRVLRLLEAQERAERADSDKSPIAQICPPLEVDPVPEWIGPYRVLERIGEGGMGVVYAAEQREPLRRRVAVKVIKVGMDTKEVLTRFEAERQAMAMVDHVGVA
jgi:hypothetical protein